MKNEWTQWDSAEGGVNERELHGWYLLGHHTNELCYLNKGGIWQK